MYQRILVPLDGSEPSRRGLAEALRLAKLTGATLCFTHVLDELAGATGFESGGVYLQDVLESLHKTGQALLDEASAQAAAAGVASEVRLVLSGGWRVAARIIEQAQAWKAQLIIIGSHGRRGAARVFMGSDAEHILRLSPVPVLIVKPGAETRSQP